MNFGTERSQLITIEKQAHYIEESLKEATIKGRLPLESPKVILMSMIQDMESRIEQVERLLDQKL